MARKPAVNQMKEHEKTYSGFLLLTKLSIIATVITMIALYCFIVVEQPILGGVLLIVVMPAAVISSFVTRAKSQS